MADRGAVGFGFGLNQDWAAERFKRSGIETGKGQGIGMATARFRDAEPGGRGAVVTLGAELT